MPKIGAKTIAQVISFLSGELAKGICHTHEDHCKGSNQKYDDFESCLEFLTKRVRFGAAYELGKNTLLCRMVHENMVPLRPDVHCPHIGPTGGSYCVDDETYSKKVLQPYFTHAPFIPFGFGKSNGSTSSASESSA
jgi:hypothetical protein